MILWTGPCLDSLARYSYQVFHYTAVTVRAPASLSRKKSPNTAAIIGASRYHRSSNPQSRGNGNWQFYVESHPVVLIQEPQSFPVERGRQIVKAILLLREYYQ
jgi:hypothetical protein